MCVEKPNINNPNVIIPIVPSESAVRGRPTADILYGKNALTIL